MIGLSAFKRKPRQFGYQPRYYDMDKEARDQRRRELLGDDFSSADSSGKPYVPGLYIRNSRLARMNIGVARKTMQNTALTRVIIFLVILLVAGYFIISSSVIETFLNKIM